MEDLSRPDIADRDGIYSLTWDTDHFAPSFTGASDATGLGVSYSGGNITSMAVAANATGQPAVVWGNTQDGQPKLYLRSNTVNVGTVNSVTGSVALQSLIDSGNLSPGDAVVLMPGNYAASTTFSPLADGVHFLGGENTRIDGDLLLAGVSD